MFEKIGILGALSELLEPHLFFGRTGALKFGTIGVHRSEPLRYGMCVLRESLRFPA